MLSCTGQYKCHVSLAAKLIILKSTCLPGGKVICKTELKDYRCKTGTFIRQGEPIVFLLSVTVCLASITTYVYQISFLSGIKIVLFCSKALL